MMIKMIAVLLMIGITPAIGDGYKVEGNLSSLVIEIQRIRALNDRYRQEDPGDGRYGFRYDLVDQKLEGMIQGIETHLRVLNSAPRLDRLRIAQ